MCDVTLMGQPDWVTRFPDIRSNSSLGVSRRVFLPRLTIVWVQSVKQTALPSMGRSHPTWWRPEEHKGIKGRFALCLCGAKTLVFPCAPTGTDTTGPPGSQAFRPGPCNKPLPVPTYPVDSVSLRTLWGRVGSPEWAQPAFGSHLCH